jgi:hypothetical protein
VRRATCLRDDLAPRVEKLGLDLLEGIKVDENERAVRQRAARLDLGARLRRALCHREVRLLVVVQLPVKTIISAVIML